MVQAGERVEGYELVRPIGRGGFASVWLARDAKGGDDVAIKILDLHHLEPSARGPSVADRFLEEARILQSAAHPGVVRVRAVIDKRKDHLLAYVMDHEAGRDLSECLPELDLVDVLEIMATVCETLGALHDRGVIHRDVKASNIIVDAAGSAKLIDFGVAKDLVARSLITSTATGQIVGTVQSMAPETFRRLSGEDLEITGAIDQWGVGIALYYCLSGEQPFNSDSIIQLMTDVERNPAPPLEIMAHFEAGRFATVIERLIGQCLQKDPRKRFASVADVGVVLRRIAQGYVEAHNLERPAKPRVDTGGAKDDAETSVLGWEYLQELMAGGAARSAAEGADGHEDFEDEETLTAPANPRPYDELETLAPAPPATPSSTAPAPEAVRRHRAAAMVRQPPPVSKPPVSKPGLAPAAPAKAPAPARRELRLSIWAVLAIVAVAFALGWLVSRS